jgi:hypothetical protein
MGKIMSLSVCFMHLDYGYAFGLRTAFVRRRDKLLGSE